MKVVRLKRGYRIRVSDVEMRLLNALIIDGLMMREGDDNPQATWSPAEKAALTRRANKTGVMAILSTDEDHRGTAP